MSTKSILKNVVINTTEQAERLVTAMEEAERLAKQERNPMLEDELEDIPDDARYVLAPKGIATLSMLQSGIVTTWEDPRIDGFWTLFEQGMRQAGYVEDDEKEQDG